MRKNRSFGQREWTGRAVNPGYRPKVTLGGAVWNAETLTWGLRNLYWPGSGAMGFMDQTRGRIQDTQTFPSPVDHHQLVIKRETRL